MRSEYTSLLKESRTLIRIPKAQHAEFLKSIARHDLRGPQELFDALVISGIIMRREGLIKMVREFAPIHRERYKIRNLAKLKKNEKLPSVEQISHTIMLYKSDFLAVKQFVIDENIKQQWLWEILFVDGFLTNRPEVIEIIERCRELKINKRKKAVARLANDKYITYLEPTESADMLKSFTEMYDNVEFDPDIQEEIIRVSSGNFEPEEKEIEDAFDKKIESMRKKRNRDINKIVDSELDLE